AGGGVPPGVWPRPASAAGGTAASRGIAPGGTAARRSGEDDGERVAPRRIPVTLLRGRFPRGPAHAASSSPRGDELKRRLSGGAIATGASAECSAIRGRYSRARRRRVSRNRRPPP